MGDPVNGSTYGVAIRGPGSNGVVRNNIILNTKLNSYGAMDGGFIQEAGNNLTYNAPAPSVVNPTDIVGQDPLFVDAVNGDFHLQAASPAIDNGADVGILYDREGNKRPTGEGVDIGPYEFQGIKVNTPPNITITAPLNGQTFNIGSRIDISSNVTDDGEPVKVEYFIDGTKIGESTQTPFGFEISDIQEGMHRLYAVAYDDDEASTKSNEVVFFCNDTPYTIVGNGWVNIPFETPQQGLMRASYDIIPLNETGSVCGDFGLTFVEADEFKDLPAIICFEKAGYISAMNGSKYSADNVIKFTPFKKHHIVMNVDIPGKTYSIYITDEEGNTQVLGSNYAFRTKMSQPMGDTLNRFAFFPEFGAFAISGINACTRIPAEGIDIVENNATVEVGSTINLTANILPEDATDKELTWISSNPMVATVDGNGTVTGVSDGTARITSKVIGTDFMDTCTVAVKQLRLITLTAPQSVAKNQTFTVIIGLKASDQILNADLGILYNKFLVKYEGYKRIDGGLLVTGSVDRGQGQESARFLLAGTGTESAVTGEVQLIELEFRARENITKFNAVSVTSATLVDTQGNILLPVLPDGTAPVFIPGDLNLDGLVNVVDLDFVSRQCGKDWQSPDWNTARIADLNLDCKVNAKDLELISRYILK